MTTHTLNVVESQKAHLNNARVAFIGPNANADSFAVSTEHAFIRAGRNTGNYAFWNAVASHIQGRRTYFPTWGFDPVHVRENFDVVVLPASNFLHPDRDMGLLASKLETIQLPVVVMGLGAQAPSSGDKIELKPGTIRFAKVLSDFCNTIGVRGEFTANALSNLGIKNVTVLGCPSNLTNLAPGLGLHIEKELHLLRETGGKIGSIAVNIDAHRQKFLKEFRALRSAIQGAHFQIVCQNPIELVGMARGESYDLNNPHVVFQKKLWCPNGTEDEFRRFVKARFVVFFQARAWLEYLKKFDLSIGTRFHGNMLAFQAGIASIFIKHDARTSELVDLLRMPTCDLQAIVDQGVAGALATTEFDGSAYDQRRKELGALYVNMLSAAKLAVSPELQSFISASSKSDESY